MRTMFAKYPGNELNLYSRGCEESYPSLDMDEAYEVEVDTEGTPHSAKIISYSVWGVLRALETFRLFNNIY